jgi:cyanophycinase
MAMRKQRNGRLILIGGGEGKKQGKRVILEEIARRANERNGKLVILTVATQLPNEVAATYASVFEELGVCNIIISNLRTRVDAHDEAVVAEIATADVIFITGGDQLRITSQMGNTPALNALRHAYEEGATIAGTSAGAAAMSETMFIGGRSDTSNTISTIGMAPGLALVSEVIIDSHFAERGRFGRLLGAVVQNPENLGLGIDENTAIVTRGDGTFCVLGTGAVYVMDGTDITYSSLSEKRAEGVVSIYDVKLHVLAESDTFDLNRRRPCPGACKETSRP